MESRYRQPEYNGKPITEISPRRKLLDINMKEVWQYRDLIVLFVKRDLVTQYKQTILGPLWYIVNPLLTTIIFTLIFGKVAGLSTDGLPQWLFYMSGTVLWGYFSNCLNSTSNTFVRNAVIFGKVYFPRLVMPIAAVIANLVQFFVQFLFLGLFMLYFWLQGADFRVTHYVVLIPLLIMMMASLSLGFGIIISSLTTKYRDLINLVGSGVRLWMYATPIIYPLSQIPEKYQVFVIINPVTPIVEYFRYALLGAGTIASRYLIYSCGFSVLVLFVGIMLFNRIEQNFMDTV